MKPIYIESLHNHDKQMFTLSTIKMAVGLGKWGVGGGVVGFLADSVIGEGSSVTVGVICVVGLFAVGIIFKAGLTLQKILDAQESLKQGQSELRRQIRSIKKKLGLDDTEPGTDK